MGGRGQYHCLIVWRREGVYVGDRLQPYKRYTYWYDGCWHVADKAITVEEIYGGHATWVAEQIEPRMRRAA